MRIHGPPSLLGTSHFTHRFGQVAIAAKHVVFICFKEFLCCRYKVGQSHVVTKPNITW